MRIREDESGQMLVMTALSLVLLLGFVALAVDVGVLFRAQRNMQIAADAAAVAAALDNQYGTATPTAAAQAAALANGVASSYVTVNNPPVSGWHTGVGYIEVIVSQPNPTYFMGLFGFNSINVAARSVAGIVPSPSCIYVLNTTNSGTPFWVKGGAKGGPSIVAPGCGIQVNSPSGNAFCDQGGATVDAPYIHIVGSQSPTGKCGKQPSGGAPVTSTGTAIPDPYNNLTGPTLPSQCSQTSAATNLANTTIIATGGTYCFTNMSAGVTLNNVSLKNGTFVFMNGVSLNGTVNVTGTLDVEQGQFSQGNATLNITAPADTSNPYNSIGFMVPSTNTLSTCGSSGNSVGISYPPACVQLQFGSGQGTMDGIIYAPAATVWLQDSGGGVQALGVVAWNLFNNSQIDISSYNQQHPSTTPLSTVSMVE
jgi:hypothetical protein